MIPSASFGSAASGHCDPEPTAARKLVFLDNDALRSGQTWNRQDAERYCQIPYHTVPKQLSNPAESATALAA